MKDHKIRLLTFVRYPEVHLEADESGVESSPGWSISSWFDGKFRGIDLSPIKVLPVASVWRSCETVSVAITYNYYSHYRMNLFLWWFSKINADLYFVHICTYVVMTVFAWNKIKYIHITQDLPSPSVLTVEGSVAVGSHFGSKDFTSAVQLQVSLTHPSLGIH